jgi:DNA repair protein RecN (Recombination protein N)
MLINLFIKDFGLVQQEEINFGQGLNVLTGETGAGKSIILEALQVVLGGRASGDYIRTGAERAVIQGTFDIDGLARVKEILGEAGMAPDEDGMLLLSREINSSGRNICRVNGQAAPLGQYRLIGGLLVDMQVQHEQHTLLDAEHQLDLLDSFGGPGQREESGRVAAAYRHWKDLSKELHAWRDRDLGMDRRIELVNYQLKEIDSVGLRAGEYEELQRERSVLANAEKIKLLLSESHAILHSGEAGIIPVVDLLSRACRAVEQLAGIDAGLSPLKDTLAGCLYQVEDTARELSGYLDALDFNPARLEAAEIRLAKIEGLIKKYGGTVEEVNKYRGEIAAELDNRANSKDKIASLERKLVASLAEWTRAADGLTAMRELAAQQLEKAVTKELADLEMARVKFQVEFNSNGEISDRGREKVDYHISPNPGEPLRPLSRIASGGELSRIMLAIKTILAESEAVPTLIFDEVEAGTGGKALQSVAEKLAALGLKRQIVCVTHAAAVAARANVHHHIYKEHCRERTVTRVKSLNGEERVEELARMLGGRDYEGVAMEHARQMIKNACSY